MGFKFFLPPSTPGFQDSDPEDITIGFFIVLESGPIPEGASLC
jgi:hypothetical protein